MYLVGNSSLQGPGTVLVQRIPWTAAQESQMAGMGCASCGGCCQQKGMGLFDAGFDFSQWNWTEWALVALGAYVVVSMINDTRSAVVTVRRKARGVRKAIAS